MRARSLLALAFAVAPSLASAQASRRADAPDKRCDVLDFPNTEATRALTVEDPLTGQRNTFLGGGVVAKCRGQDITITADSAESYGSQRIHYLLGNVHYREPRVSIDAQRVTYFQNEERLLAEIAVQARMKDGSTMTGPSAEYFRAVPPIRTVARLVAPNRPVFLLVQKDSVTQKPKQTTLTGDHVTAEGDSLYYAGGAVTITNDEVIARGDSAFMDQGKETARLMRGPSIQGRGERPFTLTGAVIDLYSKDRLLQRVLSRDSAHVVSSDVDLQSDTIDLRITANKLDRAIAWGPSRAHAKSPDRDIFADSLDILMPGQQIREVHALRNAYAETTPDSAKIHSTERDWVRGDTLIALFDSLPPRGPAADTSARNRLKRMVANGSASSYYQVPSSKGKSERPSINYVRGRLITVSLDSGTVQKVTVVDEASGVYLEPVSDSTAAKKPGRRAPAARAPRIPARPPIRRP
jgi:lipopolysaccharide export system protein LptA